MDMELPEVDIKHILYTTDFSENARLAYAYAKRIANQFQTKLTMLHVIREEPLDLLIFDVGADRSGSVPRRLSIEKAQLQKATEIFKEKVRVEYGCDEGDCDEIIVKKGNPVQTILRVAEERNCDFIVMGAKGRGSLEDALMGDTVRRVLRRSDRPVLVLRDPAEK
jgi:nucleotide-binding universal stress UspA family protein